jgi:hypothetical protein
LETAFPARDLAGGISMRQAELDDNYRGDDLAAMRQAYASDITHSWHAIPVQDVLSLFDAFSVFVYLDQKGSQYYLPAALRASLLYPDSTCLSEPCTIPEHDCFEDVIGVQVIATIAAMVLATLAALIVLLVQQLAKKRANWFATLC